MITGLCAIPIAYTIFTSNIYMAPVIVTFLLIVQGAVLIASLPLYLLLGWGIWWIKPWVWRVSVIVNSVLLIVNIVGGVVLIALLNIILLLGLYAPDVRTALLPYDD